MIILPWPPKELSPNAKRRSHWRRYAPIAATYRMACKGIVRGAGYREGHGLKITSITFFPPDRRKRDDDGMIGAFKNGRDGVADALGSDDHKFRPTYCFGEPVKGGRIEVTIA